MKKVNLPKLVASIAVCQAAGIIGAFFTTPAIEGWYSTLVKPHFTPPSWVFGPAWITLYTLMGIALYLVWMGKGKKTLAYIFFGIQLALNSAWSIIFFGLKSPAYALVEISILAIMILLTMATFCKIRTLASALMVPYIIWVTYAMLLNYGIWQLNM